MKVAAVLSLVFLSSTVVAFAFEAGAESDSAPSGEPIPCSGAAVQSPINVTRGSIGSLIAPFSPALRIYDMVHVNTHFHRGAEHVSAGEYDVPFPPPAHGYACAFLPPVSLLRPYNFEHCEGTRGRRVVGGTYEFHWVSSTGGIELGGGLGGAFASSPQPEIVVRAQVVIIVNDADGAPEYDRDMLNGSDFDATAVDLAKYVGSTTGAEYDGDNCSPFTITWHVDRKCSLVSARSVDAMCKGMAAVGALGDTKPHASRELVGEALTSTIVL